MPQGGPVPKQDAQFNEYLINVKPYLNSNAARLQVSSDNLTALNSDFNEWHGTDGTNGVYAASKNADIPESALSDSDRNTLKLKKRDTVPTPRGKIDEVPFVEFISKAGGRIQVRSRVSKDASRASMPPLADAVEIKYLIGTTAPANFTVAINSFVSKKALFFIETDGTKAGQRFFGFARYINLSNSANNGSFGTIVSVVIQGFVPSLCFLSPTSDEMWWKRNTNNGRNGYHRNLQSSF